MKNKTIVILLTISTVLFLLFNIMDENTVLESTTQNIDVISKEEDIMTSERWIVLSNGRKVYIKDFSIWALIQVDQNYTIVYDLLKKSGKYNLRTIVPGDYNGQF